MLIILVVRWAIFLTFLLLLGEGIAGIIIFRRFVALYVRKHKILEVRIDALEKRVGMEKHE